MMEEEGEDTISVHAGFPNPAADMQLQSLDLNKLLIAQRASTYFFRVQGHDWQHTGIFDGDIAIVDRGLTPRRSDTVISWDEAKGEFHISQFSQAHPGAVIWGVITATVHQLRGKHARHAS